MENKLARIKELTELLNKAAKAYYQQDTEIMDNREYDSLYDELVALEQATGIELANSPTKKVGYEILSELPKEPHEERMLSLDKTKEVGELESFLMDKQGVLSWKLDGLTVVLTYQKGELKKAVTRGNGDIGEVITNNAKVFKNIPLKIAYKAELIVRGEAIIKYSDFEKINAAIDDIEGKYKNPRNLCSGSVRQLNNEITAQRNVNFYCFGLVRAEGKSFDTRVEEFDFLGSLGFEVVEHVLVDAKNIAKKVKIFSEKIIDNDIASDGLVLSFNDIAYASTLGTTAKYPKHSIAFKWRDEEKETVLKYIEWSTSRTGAINPIAVFEPVELEGTTVARASLHNVSILQGLQLGIGDIVTVYKANMIIPQLADNLTRSDNIAIPTECPVCAGIAEIRQENDVKTLYCTNDYCAAKKIKSFSHFVSRDAMNIEGMSEATLEKFIDNCYISKFADIFQLSNFREEIINLDGFGDKSFERLIKAIDNARQVKLPNLIYSLGIQNVGLSYAKLICKNFEYNLEAVRKADVQALVAINGVGEIIAKAFNHYFSIETNNLEFDRLLEQLSIEKVETDKDNTQLAGKVFVITGSLEHFENRNALKDLIEEKGGKVSGSISGNTAYLINNDVTSNSTKNKKAKELGVPIISEEDFLNLLQG